VRNCTNAGEADAVIFVGAGVTAALNKLVHGLEVASLARAHPKNPPVVLVGPFEHHSNILPWRDAGAKVVRVCEDPTTGLVDLSDLAKHLGAARGGGGGGGGGAVLVVGAFSAASNVTGIICETDPVTTLLHTHGALAIWDYATAGPYCQIDMNPGGRPEAQKDAVVVSPHKFVGGVASAGVLIAKKSLFRASAPESPGGGAVFYVTRDGHRSVNEPTSQCLSV
jgi:selenocysteine lyase/cysteine desulfurase